jgi:hypothetical protein
MSKLYKQRRLDNPTRSVNAFLFGVAHAFDFGGRLACDRGRFSEGWYGDMKALKGDWQWSMAAHSNEIDNGPEE